MKINYLLIDYENVQPKSLALLNGIPFKVLVFLGANQAKIPVELATALQSLGADAAYVQISGNGPNAVDFHIAFTIGELSKTEPDAYFHIISKDTGFDPLIAYVRQKGIRVQRAKDIADIPLLKISNAKTSAEKIEAIVKNLASRTGKPRKVKTLANTINSIFSQSLDQQEIAQIIKTLQSRELIAINDENVTYHLSVAGQLPNET